MIKPTSKHIYAIATMDTKGEEIAYIAESLRLSGAKVVTVDVGTASPPTCAPDIDRTTVAECHPSGQKILSIKDRGEAVTAMGEALAIFLANENAEGRLSGAIGIGGTGGTALITQALRGLPLGVPKLMVSTVAGGDVSAYVQESNIVMVPSIVDVAGLNRVSTEVFGRAAGAIAGMVGAHLPQLDVKPCAAITMFGVTTQCVDRVRAALEASGWDVLVFHATGAGGRSMEALVEAGLVEAVIDITTTEVADEIVGGVFPAGPSRFDAILNRRIPYVLSVGAVDMVNFWAPETVPGKYADRLFHRHNANVTLMRTTPEENRSIARWISQKLNKAKSAWTLLIPEGGVSAIDIPGQSFHDPEADAALFDELENTIEPKQGRCVLRRAEAINDPAFADAIVSAFEDLVSPPANSKH